MLRVTTTANTMQVTESFSGLLPTTSTGLPSGTTASHIHCCLASPFLTGSNVMVATTTPTFPGFPLGVTAGSYSMTFNLLDTIFAAKEATATIPIVFTTGVDPVKAGLVTALNKPGGNITGITSTNAQLGAKWIGLMHDLLPNATRFALLVNPGFRLNTAEMVTDIQGAAATIGLQAEVLYAGTIGDLETALAGAARKGKRALS